jgi:hypothetical protein
VNLSDTNANEGQQQQPNGLQSRRLDRAIDDAACRFDTGADDPVPQLDRAGDLQDPWQEVAQVTDATNGEHHVLRVRCQHLDR